LDIVYERVLCHVIPSLFNALTVQAPAVLHDYQQHFKFSWPADIVAVDDLYRNLACYQLRVEVISPILRAMQTVLGRQAIMTSLDLSSSTDNVIRIHVKDDKEGVKCDAYLNEASLLLRQQGYVTLLPQDVCSPYMPK
jgi:hypothetical protein